MKTAILYVSVHHGNTRKVAAAMAEACSAELIDLTAQAAVTISDYDRIGLASGCFYGNMHETLRQFVEKTDFPAEQEVFLVCTCGCVYRDYTKAVKKMLQEKGVTVSASFQCRLRKDTRMSGIWKRQRRLSKGCAKISSKIRVFFPPGKFRPDRLRPSGHCCCRRLSDYRLV